MRDADQRGWASHDRLQVAIVNLERTGQVHLDRFVGSWHFPRIGPREPVIWQFELPAVAQGLAEDAVFIAQSRPHARYTQGCHRVEKTRSQPAQAAVAETRVGLFCGDRQWI